MQRCIPFLVACLCVGCFNPTALQVSNDEATDTDAAAAVDAGPAPDGGAAPAAGAQAIPDVPAQVVDKQVAMAENANLRETENGIDAVDPVSAASQSYFSFASRLHLANFQNQINISRELNGRHPTFDEFAEMMQVHQIEFEGLKPWQMYAYDSSDGTVCILEDPEVKRARYEAAGIEYEE